ncbi:hypothetical protein M9Y10_028573 [Tritrichomonas musculus]|uniref:Uncharacterized protein n=1 Tax=Tritrichomonas musculus TaxID=1915356 RepID=A0ABR2KN35_9EUKA
MNLEYLQESHTFHVERIMDFLSRNLPLCAVHQTRTIIFFCYLFACLIEFLLYPPYSVGNTPFTNNTLLIPIIIVVCLHIILAIFYVFGALFERASCVTGLGLMFFFHVMVPLVFLIGYIIVSTTNVRTERYYFAFSIIFALGFFLDFICGVLSRKKQVVALTFEILAVVPAAILASLYYSHIIKKVWIPFLPPFIYFGIYFTFLIFLSPCCGVLHQCSLKFLSDPEISVEFEAAIDPQLKPFKSRTDWVDEPDALGSDHGIDSIGTPGTMGIDMGMNLGSGNPMALGPGGSTNLGKMGGQGPSGIGAGSIGAGIGIGSGSGTTGGSGLRRENRPRWMARTQDGETITRFPSRADFQLYNVDGAPKSPLYLASPLPMLLFAVFLSLILVQCITPLTNFYLWLALAFILLIISIMLNSRATACSVLAITNLDDRNVDILWDHPSLSLL